MPKIGSTIFVRRHRGLSRYHDEVFYDDGHVVRTLTKLDDASTAHRKLGDIARGGHVLVNIRKFTGIPFRALASWSSGTC
jgi:pilus assembly protein CpaF